MVLKQAQEYIVKKLEIDDNKFFEAKVILKEVLGVSEHNFLLNNINVSNEKLKEIDTIIKLRNRRYPLQYILGHWEFFGLDFKVGDGVLIPRSDTETLCEVVIDLLKDKSDKKIIDLCSGSGCIAITLDKMTKHNHNIYALEKSHKALKYLYENKNLNQSNIIVLEDDVLNPTTLESEFDVIVANPPYLSLDDMTKMQQEVSFEPKMALYSQNNGYYFYEKITDIWYDRLKQNGLLIYEVGINQSDTVKEIMEKKGFFKIRKFLDINSIERVIIGEKR